MESSRKPMTYDAALEVLLKQLNRYKNQLRLIIDDDIPESFSEKGKYKEMIVPGDPDKSTARTYFNLIVTYENFLKKAAKQNTVNKLAKAGAIASYTKRIFDELSKAFGCDIVYATTVPNADKLKKVDGTAQAAYVYVEGAGGKPDRLFYIRRDDKTCLEIALPEGERMYRPRSYEKDKAYPIKTFDLGWIAEFTTHSHPTLDDVSKDSIMILEAQLALLSASYNEDTKKYNADVVRPILDELMKGLPVKQIVPILKILFPLLPDDFNLKEYLDVNNTKENPDVPGLGSFNEYLGVNHERLSKEIEDAKGKLKSSKSSEKTPEKKTMASTNPYTLAGATAHDVKTAMAAKREIGKEKKEEKKEEKKGYK